jgi:mannose-1-phosphate guanylyltransferase
MIFPIVLAGSNPIDPSVAAQHRTSDVPSHFLAGPSGLSPFQDVLGQLANLGAASVVVPHLDARLCAAQVRDISFCGQLILEPTRGGTAAAVAAGLALGGAADDGLVMLVPAQFPRRCLGALQQAIAQAEGVAKGRALVALATEAGEGTSLYGRLECASADAACPDHHPAIGFRYSGAAEAVGALRPTGAYLVRHDVLREAYMAYASRILHAVDRAAADAIRGAGKALLNVADYRTAPPTSFETALLRPLVLAGRVQVVKV